MPTFVCPICGRSVTVASLAEAPARPFCSLRCQRIDLGRWLNEEYRISEEIPPEGPVAPQPDAAADEPSED
mgnify:CR=1 FL=1